MPEPALTTRQCPFCKEEVKVDAIRCKHCYATIPQVNPTHGGVCPFCKEDIHPEAIRCKHCKADLTPGGPEDFFQERRSRRYSSPFQRSVQTPLRLRRAGQPGRTEYATRVDPSGCPETVMEGSSMWCLEYVEWDIDTNQTYCVYTECAIV
jgi:double zinc ribbon protein